MPRDPCVSQSRSLITPLTRVLPLGDRNIRVNKYNHELLHICWNLPILFYQQERASHCLYDLCVSVRVRGQRGANVRSS